eukprot:TRINITY_DN12359_c0_g1_i1.p2 TRINITY_DN12359_c0_g1~~TRINITY_DN12359_c0_g1_i1.p2  ORF type:complete len:115 (+),score=8.98 TRINITY_DN12359_c0_g1_i1:114-458(+)
MRVNPNVKIRSQNSRASDTEKVLIHLDSRAVAMEVGICQGVCNNSPAEWISPENFWRYSEIPILDYWGKCASSYEQDFFFQAEDGIRDVERSRGLGDVYKRQSHDGLIPAHVPY